MFRHFSSILLLFAGLIGLAQEPVTLSAQTHVYFRTAAEQEFQVRVEADRMYRAEWSSDLIDWRPLGDLFLPHPDTTRHFPSGPHGFSRLLPGPWVDEMEPLVVVIGDSTVADLSAITPTHHGWGQVIQDFFQPPVRIVNLAVGGVGTRQFFRDGRINHVNRLEPDVVVIQFGHIDFKLGLSLDEYEENLAILVRAVRRINAIPVLVSPVARRLFDEKGQFLHELAPWRLRVIAVSEREHVALVDLNGSSAALYRRLGPEQSGVITVCGDACTDQSHFSRVGAYVMASLATRDFPPLLRRYTVSLEDLVPKVVSAFRYIKWYQGHEAPFLERSRGFHEEEIWKWVYPGRDSSEP